MYSPGEDVGNKPAAIAYDTVTDDAPKEPAAKPPAATASGEGGTVSLETSNPLYRPYFDRIREAIAAAWSPPAGGKNAGRLVVLFTLDRSGALLDISVENSSGNRERDFAATKAVKSSSPFGDFPPEITDTRLAVRARFVSP